MINIDYRNKVVLITGAGSGFGRLAAQKFSQAGAKLALSDINESSLQETVKMLSDSEGECTAKQCDVTDETSVKSFVDHTVDTYGQLDAAINNAGAAHPITRLADCDEQMLDLMLNVNVKGVFFCMKHEIQHMLKQDAGVILNLSSAAGVIGAPGLAPYSASKHAVIGLTKSAVADYSANNIRINTLCPSFATTPMVTDIIDKSDKLKRSLENANPMRRLGTADEIVNAMLWLCSEHNSFMSGASISLDGGLTAV
jgi:NAD(P)-dependent dehydrogenase (short-subunit alcohol dehydrogenase family)